MITLQLLEENDIINPNHWVRPLLRSADFSSYSDTWLSENTYGGGPADTLKWFPVWLKLGDCWWGKSYKEFFGKSTMEYEFVSGDIPKEHQLDISKWEYRHPLYYEKYQFDMDEFKKEKFPIGKNKGMTVEQCYDLSYFEWFINNVNSDFSKRLDMYINNQKYKNWYNTKFKEFS